MMTALDQPLVQDYLRRLREEARRLPVDDAHDLETQIREHLLEALGDAPADAEVRETLDRLGEPSVVVGAAAGTPWPGERADPTGAGGRWHDDPSGAYRTGEDRGSQDRGTAGTRGAGAAQSSDGAWREAGALVGLVGSLLLVWLPLVNVLLWLGGLVLLVLARRWSVADKLWGAVVLGLVPWLALAAGAAAWITTGQVCEMDAAGVESCTGGAGAGAGVSNLGAVTIVLAVALVVLYLWTVVRLARKATRPA